MLASLLDVNVWLAAAFEAHPGHRSAQGVLLQTTPAAPALFCRATQQSFLRLGSTPAIFKAYQATAITNQDALAALQAFQTLPQVDLIDEPICIEERWWRLAGLAEAAPKPWMDTFDQGFRQFLEAGLDLELLQGDGRTGLSRDRRPSGSPAGAC
ncbi:MAG: hypothetical protein WBN89_11085 [Prochlorococcaceae cyanobacterium]